MTKHLDEELSALLDGELDAARALQLSAEIAANDGLQQTYDELARVDVALRDIVEQTCFSPAIAFPESAATPLHWFAIVGGAIALLLARFLPKLTDLWVVGAGVQIVAAVAVAVLLISLSHEQERHDAAV
jgi:hypothetical protein